MERQKIHREYLLNATSKSILWSAISTPTGLEGWFADRVQSDDKIVTFFWGKTEHRDAEIIAVRAFSFIQYSAINSAISERIGTMAERMMAMAAGFLFYSLPLAG